MWTKCWTAACLAMLARTIIGFDGSAAAALGGAFWAFTSLAWLHRLRTEATDGD